MFTDIKLQVQANFNKMAEENDVLFYVGIDRDEVWNQYLGGFKEADRQGHNCNSCKSFLRQYAGIVAIQDGTIVTIWDGIDADGEYITTISNLQTYVRSLPIVDVFYNPFKKCGTDKNKADDGTVWNHFFIELSNKFIKKRDIDEVRGKLRTKRDTFKRALDELSLESAQDVLELIDQKEEPLYRGTEHRHAVEGFIKAKKFYDTIADKDLYAWKEFMNNPGISGFRNSVIGTLLTDISKGMEMEHAVRSYESKVAPTNYKRSSAIASPKMIANAKAKIVSLGMMPSLERRLATPDDVGFEDFLFIDMPNESADVFDEVSADASKGAVRKKSIKATPIFMDQFISDVIPEISSMEVLVENSHLSRMVSLVTAKNQDAPSMFKWDNPFSWSYTGGITDTIKERVKKAGGDIHGYLRLSLSWENIDDLDIHLEGPDGPSLMYKRKKKWGGFLDIDENAGHRRNTEPVENIIFKDNSQMPEGRYSVMVHQYLARNNADQGWKLQIEYDDNIVEISGNRNVTTKDAFVFEYSEKDGITFSDEYNSSVSVTKKWGITSQSFVKVNKMLLSPNYWAEEIGNKHYMFMLEDCVNDEKVKPFFNEFLHSKFSEDRKAFEMISNKLNVETSSNQLSGLGFSETIPAEIIVRTKGSKLRTYKITI